MSVISRKKIRKGTRVKCKLCATEIIPNATVNKIHCTCEAIYVVRFTKYISVWVKVKHKDQFNDIVELI